MQKGYLSKLGLMFLIVSAFYFNKAMLLGSNF